MLQNQAMGPAALFTESQVQSWIESEKSRKTAKKTATKETSGSSSDQAAAGSNEDMQVDMNDELEVANSLLNQNSGLTNDQSVPPTIPNGPLDNNSSVPPASQPILPKPKPQVPQPLQQRNSRRNARQVNSIYPQGFFKPQVQHQGPTQFSSPTGSPSGPQTRGATRARSQDSGHHPSPPNKSHRHEPRGRGEGYGPKYGHGPKGAQVGGAQGGYGVKTRGQSKGIHHQASIHPGNQLNYQFNNRSQN